MTDADYTHMTLVVDRSGSMDAIREDAQGAIRGFIKDQKAHPGRATLTLAQFDSSYEVVYDNKDLQEIDENEFTLVPRGMTALLDAWGHAMTSTGEFLASLPEDERPANVIFAVVTDGQENSSQEFVEAQVKMMTDRQRNDYSWQVVFLAANMDAVTVAAQYGVAPSAAMSWGATSKGAASSYASLSSVVRSVRSGTVNAIAFDDEMRKSATGTK